MRHKLWPRRRSIGFGMLQQYTSNKRKKLDISTLHQSFEPVVSIGIFFVRAAQLIQYESLSRNSSLPGFSIASDFRFPVRWRQNRVRRRWLFAEQASQRCPYFRVIQPFRFEGAGKILFGRQRHAVHPSQMRVRVAKVRDIMQCHRRARLSRHDR